MTYGKAISFFVSTLLVCQPLTHAAHCPNVKEAVFVKSTLAIEQQVVSKALEESKSNLPHDLRAYAQDMLLIWKIRNNQSFILKSAAFNLSLQAVTQLGILQAHGPVGLISIDFILTAAMAVIANSVFIHKQAKPILAELKQLNKIELVKADLQKMLVQKFPEKETQTLIQKIGSNFSPEYLITLAALAVTAIAIDTLLTLRQLPQSPGSEDQKEAYIKQRLVYNSTFLSLANLKLVAVTTLLYALESSPKAQLLTRVIDRMGTDFIYFYFRDSFVTPLKKVEHVPLPEHEEKIISKWSDKIKNELVDHPKEQSIQGLQELQKQIVQELINQSINQPSNSFP